VVIDSNSSNRFHSSTMMFSKTNIQGLALFSVTILFFLSNASVADIVVNGSFEADDIPSTGYNDPGFITGWVVNEDPDNQVTLFDRADLIAPDGNQFVTFNGGGTAPTASIFQTLSTVNGGTYDVSFWTGANIPARSRILGQVFNGVGTAGMLIASEEGNIGALNAYQETTFTFQALSSSTTFVFADNSTSSIDSDVFLDHLVIVRAVPEPSSFAIMAAIGIVVGIRRRK